MKDMSTRNWFREVIVFSKRTYSMGSQYIELSVLRLLSSPPRYHDVSSKAEGSNSLLMCDK